MTYLKLMLAVSTALAGWLGSVALPPVGDAFAGTHYKVKKEGQQSGSGQQQSSSAGQQSGSRPQQSSPSQQQSSSRPQQSSPSQQQSSSRPQQSGSSTGVEASTTTPRGRISIGDSPALRQLERMAPSVPKQEQGFDGRRPAPQ